MNRKQAVKVYGIEDLSTLSEHLPENLQDAVNTMHYNLICHDAYNNPKYEFTKDDFELGTPLGKGLFCICQQDYVN